MGSGEELFKPNAASRAQNSGLGDWEGNTGEEGELDKQQQRLANKEQEYQNSAYGKQYREGPKTDYSQANADYAQSQQARGNQDWVGDKYRDAIEGNGPSVAEKQMNAGRDAAMRDAMSMAVGARGGALARAAAQRGAQYQQGAIAAQTNQQAAALRAQEQIAAREGYANLTAQQRAQDMQSRQLSGQQAQFLTEAELKQRSLNDQAMLGLTNASVATSGQLIGSTNSQYDSANQRYLAQYGAETAENQAARDRNLTKQGWYYKMFGTGVDMLTKPWGGKSDSDERVKTNIVPAGSNKEVKETANTNRNDIQDFLSKLEPYRYDYKNPEKHGEGTRWGVMAQDMEDSKIGKTLVEKNEDGVRQIDVKKSFSVILASLAELQKENERLAAMIEKGNKKSTNKKG